MALNRVNRLTFIIYLTVIVIAAMTIVGWVFDVSFLKSWMYQVTMKANTAACFIATASAFILNRQTKHAKFVATFLSGIVLGLASLSFFQYILKMNFGIDEFMVKELNIPNNTYPGRMSPFTAINFIGINSAFLLLRWPKLRRLSQSVVLVALFLSLVGLFGIFFGISLLYAISSSTGIAIHTAVSFILLCLAFILDDQRSTLTEIIFSKSSGSTLLKRILPLVVLIPFFIAWIISRFQALQLANTLFIVTLSAVAYIFSLSFLVLSVSRKLHEMDEQRSRDKQVLMEERERLSVTLKS